MKTVITPFIEDQTLSFLMKEGFDRGDKLIVLVPEEKFNEGLNPVDLTTLRDKISDLEIDIELEKKILKTGEFEDLVREISKIFMSSEGKVVVNLSSGNEHLLVALTVCSTYHGDSVKTFSTQNPIDSHFQEVEFPYTKDDLKENEKELLQMVVREGPLMMNELVESSKISQSKSTVSRVSIILEEKGMVNSRMSGKEKEIDSTLSGDIKAMTL